MALTRPRYSNIVDTDYKASCRVVTIINITLSGGTPATYDGVSLNIGDRVLVTAQNTASQNGIYVVQSVGTGNNGTWVRSFDANDGERITAGLQTNISEGTYAGKNWRLTTPDPITVGVTNLTFVEGTTVASGANRNLQFNNSSALAGATGLNYYTGNLALVATGNIHATANLVAGVVYTDQLLWQANSQPITLTGNINPTIYVGNTQVSTTATQVDTLPASGNAYVRWNIVAKDQVNNRYRFVTIESVNDTVNVYYNEYGSVKSSAAFEVAEFTSNITSGNINLWGTGDSGTVYVNFQRTMLGSYAPTGYINNFGPRGPAGTVAETSGNIVTTATSAATSTTTGALQVAGGAGIAGNAYIGGNAVVGTDLTVLGNLYVQGDLTRINAAILSVEDLNITLANGAATTGAANGAGISVDGPAGAQIVYIASSDRWNLNKDTKVNNLYSGGIYWSGNNAVLRTGINYYTSSAAPANANYGDKWYDTTTDILYEWQTGDGATGFWVDVGSLAIIANANLSNQAFNTVSANNINSTGNITGSNVVLGGVGSGFVYANNFIFSQNGASIFNSFGVNSYGNVNVGQYLPTHTGNLQAANVYVVGNDSLTNTSGALRVIGGVGITGNLNLYQPTASGYFANISGYGRPGAGVQAWQFYINSSIGGPNSWINFPDGTNQFTAYPGTSTTLTTFDANLGTLFLGNVSTQANLGAYQTWANGRITTLDANLGTATTNISNLVTQANANTAAYLTTYTGNVSAGNLNVGNYANIFITTGSTSNKSALTIEGNIYGRGGVGYLDAFQLTNRYSLGTNASKYIRVGPTGTFEIINNAYTQNIFSLTDAGALSIPGQLFVNGAQTTNGPAFAAYASATLQTITSGSQQKVLFQTEEYDTNSNYANSRFTPTVAGYYQLNAEVRLDGASGTGEMMIVLYKNGSEYKRGTNQSGTQIASNFWAMQVSSIAYANGTGDYFEIYVQQGSGGNVTVTAVNNPAITWFNGCMLRGA